MDKTVSESDNFKKELRLLRRTEGLVAHGKLLPAAGTVHDRASVAGDGATHIIDKKKQAIEANILIANNPFIGTPSNPLNP